MNFDGATLKVGQTHVALRFRGGHLTRTARILGARRESDGAVRIWLDRLIHPGGELQLTGIELSGAVSTVIHIPKESQLDCAIQLGLARG